MSIFAGRVDVEAVRNARAEACNPELAKLSDEQLWSVMVLVPSTDLRTMGVPGPEDRVCWACGRYTASEPHQDWCHCDPLMVAA